MATLHIGISIRGSDYNMTDALYEMIPEYYRPMTRSELVHALTHLAGTVQRVPQDAVVTMNHDCRVVTLTW